MEFGKRLRELRQARGLTLRSLADKAGLNFTYLSKIENGKVEYTPSATKIRALAQVLGIDELELLELAGKVPPEIQHLAGNVGARTFLRRAQSLTSPDDWQDLLNYLDQRQTNRKACTKKGEEG